MLSFMLSSIMVLHASIHNSDSNTEFDSTFDAFDDTYVKGAVPLNEIKAIDMMACLKGCAIKSG